MSKEEIIEILKERCKTFQFEIYEYSYIRLYPILNIRGFWDGTSEYNGSLNGVVIESEIITLKFSKWINVADEGESRPDGSGRFITGDWTTVDIIIKTNE